MFVLLWVFLFIWYNCKSKVINFHFYKNIIKILLVGYNFIQFYMYFQYLIEKMQWRIIQKKYNVCSFVVAILVYCLILWFPVELKYSFNGVGIWEIKWIKIFMMILEFIFITVTYYFYLWKFRIWLLFYSILQILLFVIVLLELFSNIIYFWSLVVLWWYCCIVYKYMLNLIR